MPRILRACAMLIALLAILDPAITSARTGKPVVAVVSADSAADRNITDRVVRNLSRSFTVVRAPFGGAAATVLVGQRLPAVTGAQLAAPIFAVLPQQDPPTVTLEDVQAPARIPLDARAFITAVVRASVQPGSKVEVELRAGDVVLDRTERTVTTTGERLRVPLAFVPAAPGVAPLRVTVRSENAQPATADLVVDVREQRWAVLFFERRPSWQSTFVRRAVERDPRFTVTSRTITARNISTAAGRPPATLAAASLAAYDAVVIGAAESLTANDVAELDAYLRQNAGGVVLLFDQQKAGPHDRLTQAGAWSGAFTASGIVVKASATGSGALRTSQVIWPVRMPAGAQVLARDSAAHAVVWRAAVGAGRLVVSGALDAWKFRDPEQSEFETFWPTLIGETADAGADALEVSVSEPVIAPGALVNVRAIVRNAALAGGLGTAPVRVAIESVVEGADGRTQFRLWPDRTIGHFRGTLRAPEKAGTYRVIVSSAGLQADAALHVHAAPQHVTPEQQDLVRAWASAHGGQTFLEAQLEELSAALENAVQPTARPTTWHPMRSPWWIVPFALLLSAEWWARRRRGMA